MITTTNYLFLIYILAHICKHKYTHTYICVCFYVDRCKFLNILINEILFKKESDRNIYREGEIHMTAQRNAHIVETKINMPKNQVV